MKVADEHNLSLVHDMPTAFSGVPNVAASVATPQAPVPVALAEEDDLSRRLAELKVGFAHRFYEQHDDYILVSNQYYTVVSSGLRECLYAITYDSPKTILN